jgi:hypothetical protein
MKECSNCHDTLCDIVQYLSRDLRGYAFQEAGRVPESKRTHHIIAVMDTQVIEDHSVAFVLLYSREKLISELFDGWAIVGKC